MKEAQFQNRLKKVLEAQFEDVSLDKIHGNEFQRTGISDLVGSWKGKYCAIECKVVDLPTRSSTTIDFPKLFSPEQMRFLKKKQKTGANVAAAVLINPMRIALLFRPEHIFKRTKKQTFELIRLARLSGYNLLFMHTTIVEI